MLDEDSLLSVGIDIGTTSTHLTVSRLYLGNLSVMNQAPHLAISKKEIVYQSPIYFTPLTEDGAIDAEAVAEIIASEYKKANLKPENIQTGAAIVTGESAKLRNAHAVMSAVTKMAGDFVVESAGSVLESILAARGSGAVKASVENNNCIANIDIGGGTTNIAIFKSGELVESSCIGIGGRFIKFSPTDTIESITDSGKEFLKHTDIALTIGDTPDSDMLQSLANTLADLLLETISQSENQQASWLWSEAPLQHFHNIDEYWFSGGVAALMQENAGNLVSSSNCLLYQDMGIYLARSLNKSLIKNAFNFKIPNDPIRATVIGTGLHTLQLTGSTIGIREHFAPIRNLPIIHPFTNYKNDSVKDSISICLRNHELVWQNTAIGIVLDRLDDLSFHAVQRLAQELASAFLDLQGLEPLVIITTHDIAMALAQFLKGILPETRAIVLDGIVAGEGDFIDIGTVLEKSANSSTRTVPVVIKSLIFR